ncbi:alpha/beta-hydrolase [Cryphonectria parasitica EP155]|uniref:Alpha/beta-hydrolase n=1 Tax=Cryphonectria parasitica (strain ATCC 38755 / EP155) TaxID=660469 RepID=A0A9P5CIV8_CRYP1|nr:alpha/beta-hydrolase [Cryphonectria parasitica EP155]KAF3760713.1 alpha/beta-hydrolase [Cryphonectria parasitica EP155]
MFMSVGYDIQQGVPVPQMQGLLHHWKTEYLPKWRQHEAKLNELPMFTMPVESDGFGTLDIHFVHARSNNPNAIPLLFVHGWPGSFLEVTKMLKGLTSPEDASSQAFHVVAPSLPNYGFSDGVKKRGFNICHYGFVLNKLMLGLGYNRHHDQSLRGNLAMFDFLNLLKKPWLILLAMLWPPFWPSKDSIAGLRRGLNYASGGNDYYRLQSTRPQTVAFCLEDPPVGLLGWMYEKLIHWTDECQWTEDEVLTWASIYWFSRAGPVASVRTYFEAENPARAWNGLSTDRKFWD